MNARWTLLAPATVAVLLLAGCAEPVKPFTQDSTIEYIERLKGFTWPDALVTDSAGNNATLDGIDPKAVAFFVQQDVHREGSNPTLAITKKDTTFVTTFDTLQKSTDEARNWSLVQNLQTDGFPKRQDKWITFDAHVAVDEKTDRVLLFHAYAGFVGPSSCSTIFWSDDDGGHWTNENQQDPSMGDNPASCYSPQSAEGFGGHPKMVTADYAGGDYPPANLRGSWGRVLYICSSYFLPVVNPMVYCATSYDSGKTFHTATVTYNSLAPSILDPATNDDDGCEFNNVGRGAADSSGVVLFPVYRIHQVTRVPCRPAVVESKDNGLSWSYRVAPAGKNRTNMDFEPQIVFAGDKLAYMVYRYTDAHVYIMRSNDYFNDNWDGPFRVSPTEQTLNSHVAILGGDSKGRLAIGYYGTKDFQERSYKGIPMPGIAHRDTVWNAYVTQTLNADGDKGEMRFVTTQVNANQDAVVVGCLGQYTIYYAPGAEYLIPPGASGAPGVPQTDCAANLLSWVNLAQDPEGRPFFTFTDSCDSRNDCIHDFSATFQSRDRMVSVAPLDFGFSMKGDKVPLEKLGLHPPQLEKRSAEE